MTAPLRIAIATNGRFHVLDLARELDRLGHHVTFYSLLPKWRSRQFGLSADRCVSLFWVMPVSYTHLTLPTIYSV